MLNGAMRDFLPAEQIYSEMPCKHGLSVFECEKGKDKLRVILKWKAEKTLSDEVCEGICAEVVVVVMNWFSYAIQDFEEELGGDDEMVPLLRRQARAERAEGGNVEIDENASGCDNPSDLPPHSVEERISAQYTPTPLRPTRSLPASPSSRSRGREIGSVFVNLPGQGKSTRKKEIIERRLLVDNRRLRRRTEVVSNVALILGEAL
ncbi:hypothetical protein F5878DRAFT_641733 [Lentinula raphanica]|uniref:Uncharacterized protein n=1 Tax=Lentinula raphanica TaxID=153919 RepID=A0AA38P9P4_9AGAR|nr:hypothetical protein F5878DRAFT_641733 [Lentinula raphanica]